MNRDMKHNVIVVAVAAIALTVTLGCFLDLNDGSLDNSDRTVKYVPTNSMDGDESRYKIDSFPAKTLIMVEGRSSIGDIRVGDVVVYNADGLTTVHRCTEDTNDHPGYLVTQGDNNRDPDPVHVTDSNLEGVVVGTSHSLGLAVGFVKNSGILLVAIVCIVLVMVWTTKDLLTAIGSRKGEE